MERQQRRRIQPQPAPDTAITPPAFTHAAASAAAASEPAIAPLVHVVHGPLSLDVALAGLTITEAYQLLQHTLNLPPGVTALVDGDEVEPRFRLGAGTVLEFVRRAGVRGARQ
jgi:hypothetical protein